MHQLQSVPGRRGGCSREAMASPRADSTKEATVGCRGRHPGQSAYAITSQKETLGTGGGRQGARVHLGSWHGTAGERGWPDWAGRCGPMQGADAPVGGATAGIAQDDPPHSLLTATLCGKQARAGCYQASPHLILPHQPPGPRPLHALSLGLARAKNLINTSCCYYGASPASPS